MVTGFWIFYMVLFFGHYGLFIGLYCRLSCRDADEKDDFDLHVNGIN